MRNFFISSFIFITVICTAIPFARFTPKQNEKEKKAELAKGKVLYEKYSCFACHGPTGILQGNLTKAYKKYTDVQIKEYIRNPNKFNNFKMPVFETVILEADYKPLIAYVKWLGEKAEKK